VAFGEDRTSDAASPRGLTNPQQFAQIAALFALNRGEVEAVITHLDIDVADESRSIDDRVMDLRLLRRAYEEFHQLTAALDAARREHLLLDEIQLPYAQILVRQSLAGFYQRHGENDRALELLDEIEYLWDTQYEDLVQGTQSLFRWVMSKATVIKLEALLASERWSEALALVAHHAAIDDTPKTTLWIMKGLVSGYEERSLRELSNGDTATTWFTRVLTSADLPGVGVNPYEYSWAEWRFLARGVESSVGLRYGNWQYPNLPEQRLEIIHAYAHRLISKWSTDDEVASEAGRLAREIEERHAIVWPYYAETFNFLGSMAGHQ